ncbi:MAG: hypothetical protein JWO05_3790 [Gemmatimonadetes bacterium]|nr:hypothetical protein [Gemmatimonadota bacterium]
MPPLATASSFSPAVHAALADNRAAVEAFARRAASLSDGQWATPRAPGKWTPAQEVRHVALVYQAFVAELRGGPPGRIRGNAFQRVLTRWVARPIILRMGKLPFAVRSPRSVNPPDELPQRQLVLEDLAQSLETFEAALHDARREGRPVGGTHPYFGFLEAREAIAFSAIHTRHHHAYLPEPAIRATT